MTVHEFRPTHFCNVMGRHEPVLDISSGEVVSTTTVDAHGFDAQGRAVSQAPNPLTGPFRIVGAEPGDCLAVRIESIEPNRTSCWTHCYLASHVIEPELLGRFPELATTNPDDVRNLDWEIDRETKSVRPIDEQVRPAVPPIPLSPMLGCIGTAPGNGEAISTSTSGRHGGNMDYLGIARGATLYFPVFVSGALFYLGDGHATQGHGEIGGTGTEVSMDVQFRVELVKDRAIGWPRGENDTYLFTLGNARPLDLALQYATGEMLVWLVDEYGLDAAQASVLLAQTVEYEVGNVFDPAYTMVCKVRKEYLERAQRTGSM